MALPATEIARQLFLYGNGDGKRIITTKALVEATGCHPDTINRNMPKWLAESEALLANSSDCGLAISLSQEQLEQNSKDLIFIRDQINQLKFELNSIEKITERLAEWLDKFEGDDVKDALRIFEDYVNGCNQKSSLRSQFIAMKKLWDEKSAIDGLRDAALTREKEISKGKAKLEIKKMETEQGVQPPRIAGGIFARDRTEQQDR